MEQHPVPRQITSFEFKLVGFFTIKQFVYMVTFVPVGFIVYSLFPIPILNIILGIGVGGIGFALALLPINDRPADVWLRNLYKRLTSPTQYMYHKENPPIYFFQDLYFLSNPHLVLTHVESKEKLSAYLAQSQKTHQADVHRQRVKAMLKNPHAVAAAPANKQISAQKPVAPQNAIQKVVPPIITPPPAIAKPTQTQQLHEVVVVEPKVQPAVSVKPTAKPQALPVTSPKEPFFTGVIKNHKLIPIPGVLIYVKDAKGTPLRLLKTNPHGIFATFNSLPPGDYIFEPKDPRNTYNFDTMKITVQPHNERPFEIFSKEML